MGVAYLSLQKPTVMTHHGWTPLSFVKYFHCSSILMESLTLRIADRNQQTEKLSNAKFQKYCMTFTKIRSAYWICYFEFRKSDFSIVGNQRRRNRNQITPNKEKFNILYNLFQVTFALKCTPFRCPVIKFTTCRYKRVC